MGSCNALLDGEVKVDINAILVAQNENLGTMRAPVDLLRYKLLKIESHQWMSDGKITIYEIQPSSS